MLLQFTAYTHLLTYLTRTILHGNHSLGQVGKKSWKLTEANFYMPDGLPDTSNSVKALKANYV